MVGDIVSWLVLLSVIATPIIVMAFREWKDRDEMGYYRRDN